MHIIANTSLLLGFVLSILAITLYIFGIFKKKQHIINSAHGAATGIFITATISIVILLFLFATNQFQYNYVYSYSSQDLAWFYKLTALWAGNHGSLLLWTFLLSLYIFIVIHAKKTRHLKQTSYIALVLLFNVAFFYSVMLILSNPFEMGDIIPSDGRGLNPMLQNPGMVLHPITLYLGYVGLAVPFAFGMASLITKQMDDVWIRNSRKWTIFAWLFLTLGNLIGAWWAYVELGWGGYWAWDPVENASFIPWLTATAYLHSVMIQERKGMLKVWNMVLIIVSYLLTLFGTFLVRSGILSSVHAFTDSDLGAWFLIFLVFATVMSIFLLFYRMKVLTQNSISINGLISKESSFLANNIILIGAAFAVFWGTVFPLVSEAVRGTKVNMGPDYFNSVMGPILLAVVFLMGVCPLIPWDKVATKSFWKSLSVSFGIGLIGAAVLYMLGVRGWYALFAFAISFMMIASHLMEFYVGAKARRKATSESLPVALFNLFRRNQRRYGGYVIHIGIAFLAIGIIGSQAYAQEVTKTFKVGESINLGDYTFRYEGLGSDLQTSKEIIFANIDVEKNGKEYATIKPEKIAYTNWEETSTEVALKSSLKEDLYVVLSTWEGNGEKATITIKINPLVIWMWIGGVVMVIGTFISLSVTNRKFMSTKMIKDSDER